MQTLPEMSVENKADWANWVGAEHVNINTQLAKSLGISEDFLLDAGNYSHAIPAAVITQKSQSLEQIRSTLLDKIAQRIMWNYCAFTAHRKGVRVHVWKPETGIHNFRSLRTAKVWNKQRLQNAKA